MLIHVRAGAPGPARSSPGHWRHCLLTTASARAADTIAVSFGADPTEEVPLPVTLTWSSQDSTAGAFLTIKPSGSLGCAPNYSADHANSRDVTYAGRQASGSKSTNWTETDPGSFLLCAYLHHDSNGESAPLATATATLTLRSARATVGVVPPARVDAGRSSRSTFQSRQSCSGASLPPKSRREAAAASRPTSLTARTRSTCSTATSRAPRQPARRLRPPGRRNLPPVRVHPGKQRRSGSGGDGVGDLPGRPLPCVTARQNLATANTAVKTVERSVTRYRTSYRRYAQRARHAHGAKRRSLLRLPARDKSRYRSAVRRRAAARGTLGKAQAAVTAACGGATAAVAGVAAETTPTNARDAIAASLGPSTLGGQTPHRHPSRPTPAPSRPRCRRREVASVDGGVIPDGRALTSGRRRITHVHVPNCVEVSCEVMR